MRWGWPPWLPSEPLRPWRACTRMAKIRGLLAEAHSCATASPRHDNMTFAGESRHGCHQQLRGKLGHGSRRAAVTKPCQAPRSPGDAVTQRHTSGSPSFPRIVRRGGGPATNLRTPPCLLEWAHTAAGCLYSESRSWPPLPMSGAAVGLGGSGTWPVQGRWPCPLGQPKRELGAAPAKAAPQLKNDLARARRQQKLSVLARRHRKG